MKRILIICNNHQSAKRKFHNMTQQNENAISTSSLTQLKINIKDTEFQFISSQIVDRIIGQTFHSVIIDEMVELTPEQTSFIMSRKRPYQPGI